jgi:hypothetical protein
MVRASCPTVLRYEDVEGSCHEVRRPPSRRGHQRWGYRGLGKLLGWVNAQYRVGYAGVEDAHAQRAEGPAMGPLGEVVTQTLDYDRVLEVAAATGYPETDKLRGMYHDVRDPTFWMDCAGDVPLTASKVPPSRMHAGHCKQLLGWGVIRPKLRHHGVGLAMAHFLVWKADKRTTRMASNGKYMQTPIMWTFPLAFPLSDLTKQYHLLHRGTCALALDMRSWFFAFRIAAIIFVRFKTSRGLYLLDRMPQGWGGSPAVAQHTLAALSFDALLLGLALLLWLDNVLAVGTFVGVSKFLATLHTRFAYVGATLKEAVISSQVDFVGLAWDFEAKTVAPLASFTSAMLAELATVQPRASFRTLLHWTGLVLWHVRVLHLPVGTHFAALFRAVSDAMSAGLGMEVILWLPDSVIKELLDYKTLVPTVPPFSPPSRPATVHHLYLDASPTGWGVVSHDADIPSRAAPARALVLHGHWGLEDSQRPQLHREALVLSQLPKLWPRFGVSEPVHWAIYVDPLPLLQALQHGFSPSALLNDEVTRILTFLRPRSYSFHHVPGILNPADEPSRRPVP